MNLDIYREKPEIVKAFQQLERPELTVDSSVRQELVSYTRSYRKSFDSISQSQYRTLESLHSLAEMFEKLQSYRSRVVRIRLGFLPMQKTLKRLWTACICVLYGEDEIVKLTPVARKDAAMAQILEPLRARLDACDTVIDTAQHVEELLTSTYYTLRELRAINEAHLERKQRERGV